MNATTTPTSAIEAIRHGEAMRLAHVAYDRFAAVAEGLTGGDWDRPTDCEGWAVRDLVGHVVGAMRSAASVREQVSQMRQIRARLPRDGGQMVDVMTQVQIDRTAASSNAELVRECRALVDRATAGRRRTPTPVRRFASFGVDMGPISERWTLGYLVDVILTRDAWLHRVDLCRAVGAELTLTADHDGRIVADVVAEWSRRHGRPFHLVLTGPAGGTFTGAGPGESERAEVDAVEFCRIVSGRAPGEGLLATPVPF